LTLSSCSNPCGPGTCESLLGTFTCYQLDLINCNCEGCCANESPTALTPPPAPAHTPTPLPPPRPWVESPEPPEPPAGVQCNHVVRTPNCACCFLLGPGVDITQGSCFDFINADLRGRNLEGAVLEDAKLDCADLSGANLKSVDMTNAQGLGTAFRFARAEGLKLEDATLEGADFTGAFLESLHAEQAELTNAIFDEATLRGAVFQEATIVGARFYGATGLDQVDFTRAIGPALGITIQPSQYWGR